MAIDRVKRDELADLVTRWMEEKSSAENVAEQFSAQIHADHSGAEKDALLELVWWRVYLSVIKRRDGERAIVSRIQWMELCDFVALLRTNIDYSAPEEQPPISEIRVFGFIVWAVSIVSVTLVGAFLLGYWAIPIWMAGALYFPIMMLIDSRKSRESISEQLNLSSTDRALFELERGRLTFRAFDPRRFEPSQKYKRERRKEILLTAPAVIFFLCCVALIWPISLSDSSNFRRKGAAASS